MKRHLLLAVFLLFAVALLNINDINAATENQQTEINVSNSNPVQGSTANIQNTIETAGNGNTGTAVDDEEKNQETGNQASSSSDNVNITSENANTTSNPNKTSNSQTSNANQTTKVQISQEPMAAGSPIVGFWIKGDEFINSVDPTYLKSIGVTDVFINAWRFSTTYPYSKVLKSWKVGWLMANGIRVHAWIVCFKDGSGSWVNPADTTFKNTLLADIQKIASNYNISGIHLDYVRYPGTAYRYTGATSLITSFVSQVNNRIGSKILSAALMPEGSVNAYYYGQDYGQLSKYLDWLVPMIYKGNYGYDSSTGTNSKGQSGAIWIGSTTEYIVQHANGKPVLAGLQTYRSDKNVSPIPASELKQDIKSSIDNGASGYVLFRYGLIDTNFFTSTSSATSFTMTQILDASARVKAYIETNHRLPNYVTISTKQVTMPQFLRILTTATLQLNSGIKTSITLKTTGYPTGPFGDNTNGKIYKAEYLNIAQRIKNFIESNGIAPNYATSTLGKIQYESTIYMYSRILNFYKNNKIMPNYATMTPWTTNSSTSSSSSTTNLPEYLQPTRNCQSNDYRITALASSLTNGVSSQYNKAVRIFNWVRDNIGYSFYYNTAKGAVGTLTSRSGNCCDTAHLVVALSRAAGIPARYVHGTCTFSSGNVYGHVWAQLYVNNKWYTADAVSSRNSFGVINNWNTNTAAIHGIYRELPF